MASESEIVDQLAARFARSLPESSMRRIVVWHDPEGEFADAFATISRDGALSGGARVVRCLEVSDGSMFEAKRIVNRLAAQDDFLLYRRRERGRLESDWFADIELYAEHFQADYLSMLIESLDAVDSADVRDAVAATRAFFAAKDRAARFSKLVPSPRSKADVYRGIIAVVVGAREASAEAIVRSYVMALEAARDAVADASEATSETPPDIVADVDKYGALDALRSLLKATIGYAGDISDARSLAAHLLTTAAAATVPESVFAGIEGRVSAGNSQFALGIVHEWAQCSDAGARRALSDICERVEAELRLFDRFGNAQPAALMGCDVFPAVDEAIIAQLARPLAQGSDRCADALHAQQERRGLAWYDRVEPYYACLAAAARMQQFYREHAAGFLLSTARDVWNAYIRDWWRMDAEYRSFCLAFSRCARVGNDRLDEPAHELASWAESMYANWFLAMANSSWVGAAIDEWKSNGYVQGIPLARRFYDDVVSAELDGAKRVVVAVSDALRFDVAQQLAEALAQERHGHVVVGAMQATFPTITSFGMASLLPHRRLRYSFETDEVLVDDQPTTGLAARERVLQASRAKSRAVQYADLMALSRAERKRFASDVEVLYVYHNTIDDAGHSETSGQDVFDACDDAVADLVALVSTAVNDLGASRVVVTADHGFLYTREGIPAADQASRTEVSGEAARVERRYLCADPDAASESFVRMNMSAIDGGEHSWWAPRDCVRIKASGSRKFVHGGVSLQETCVPVVRFRNVKKGSKGYEEKRYAQIGLLSASRTITSALFGVDLYQKEPVGGAVLPCEYSLVLTDETGNEVSDTRFVAASDTATDDRERTMRARFSLKAGVSWDSKAAYYLVARDKRTGDVLWAERFSVEIAFAPLDDFGF